jgi:hypothetical protein
MVMGIVELFVVALAFGSLVLPIWAAVDAALQPDPTWRAIGHSKIVWVLVSLFTWVIGPIAYFVGIRPRLRGVTATPQW